MIERVAAHFLAHPLGVVGLAVNMAGSLLLLPSHATWFADGSAAGASGSFRGAPVPGGKLRYSLQQWRFRVAVGSLMIGFALQLIDLLIA